MQAIRGASGNSPSWQPRPTGSGPQQKQQAHHFGDGPALGEGAGVGEGRMRQVQQVLHQQPMLHRHLHLSTQFDIRSATRALCHGCAASPAVSPSAVHAPPAPAPVSATIRVQKHGVAHEQWCRQLKQLSSAMYFPRSCKAWRIIIGVVASTLQYTPMVILHALHDAHAPATRPCAWVLRLPYFCQSELCRSAPRFRHAPCSQRAGARIPARSAPPRHPATPRSALQHGAAEKFSLMIHMSWVTSDC